MGAKASPYLFTVSDTATLISMGYKLQGIAQADLHVFMQSNFQGFNLIRLLGAVEIHMVPCTTKTIDRKLVININDLEVRLENNYTSEDDALIFHRKFYREKGTLKVDHEYLVLPIAARNQGRSKKVLKVSLEEYVNMGIKFIEVIAGLSAGAYVWARAGFVATNGAEMKSILNNAKAQLPANQYIIVKKIYDDYYGKTPKGRNFQIRYWADLPFMRNLLTGRQWSGRLNLKNKQQFRKFEKYVSR